MRQRTVRSRLLGICLAMCLGACTSEDPAPGSVPGADSGQVPGGDGGIAMGSDAGTGGEDAGSEPSDAGIPTPDAGEPECAAEGDARCFYVAPDGDDDGDGSIDSPYGTFQAAITQAGPGDYIYARGGTYGRANAHLSRLERLYSPPCMDDGHVEADGYCQVPLLQFASIQSWNGYPVRDSASVSYSVVDGEPDAMITLRNFPGERPVLDVAALRQDPAIEAMRDAIHAQRSAIGIGRSHWAIRGFEISHGSVNMGGNIENIEVSYCDIHDLTVNGGENPGLIRLNRGPERVRIHHNRLHDLFDVEEPGDWSPIDAQHFGAVTTLSGETYGGNDDTGELLIHDNEIFHVPQAFFFKNAAAGPVLIENNHIYDSDRIAGSASANITFRRNLVHGVSSGFWRHGQGYTEARLSPEEAAAVFAIDGHNLTVEYNTIVGIEGRFLSIRHGVGHVLRNNVIMGFPGTAATAIWDTSSFVSTRPTYDLPGDIESDENCFVVADEGFQAVALYPQEGRVQHYDLTEARERFGIDPNSTVVVATEPREVFEDTERYALMGETCAGAGYLAEE